MGNEHFLENDRAKIPKKMQQNLHVQRGIILSMFPLCTGGQIIQMLFLISQQKKIIYLKTSELKNA